MSGGRSDANSSLSFSLAPRTKMERPSQRMKRVSCFLLWGGSSCLSFVAQ